MSKLVLPKGSRVLVLGSGGLMIGQAGEFDYSGSQAIKALKEEGMEAILVNPNIATIQTDKGLADRVYLQPLNVSSVGRIIEKERPQGILLGVGGQTALNLGLELYHGQILKRFDVAVLGTPMTTIEITEDRELFKRALAEIGVHTARSGSANTVEEALKVAASIGFPVMMRVGYSLGGLGSGKILTEEELRRRCKEVLHHAPQVLIEEYLAGWKEIEVEVVRDSEDNCITVCNMENMDPMGIHTGESIVVAPSQTLTDKEYHGLREIALRTVRHLGVIGECNIQYALHPQTGEYRVIEVNARLSRSSALASKATGYPLAMIATKLALGRQLYELRNNVTGKTSAFFEPALDYLVVKMPRWDMQKFKTDRYIGSEMKSVGEVMAIGRSFPEALQKAVRMLNIGLAGIGDEMEIPDLWEEITNATDRRLFALYQVFRKGATVEEVAAASLINPWFLTHLQQIAKTELLLAGNAVNKKILLEAKKKGFSDRSIAKILGTTEIEIRQQRIREGILPWIKQIDTMAGEFAAQTNYLYMTYHGQSHDLEPSSSPPTMILGSGPYCIGSSVEFDWCAVNALRSFRRHGKSTIMINSNPETVSTDYDESDRLYFEELTCERVSDLADFENPEGIVVSMGGQIANNLALPLEKLGYPILGTSVTNIDQAEDRRKFSSLLNTLKIDQPLWEEAVSISQAKEFARRIGYPLLIRPSYVLSGAAMQVISSDDELEKFLKEAAKVSLGHPVVISQFIENAKELEIDGVALQGKMVIQVISEHIENAGIHSGDATIVLPPQRLYLETIRRTKEITRTIVAALNITGPFNLQFIAKENQIKVIECNVRASRSFPFVSKVTGYNLIELAVEAILGIPCQQSFETLELDCVGVKTSQFSYSRLKGANPVAKVEMASTGEVACIADTLAEAFISSWLATGQKIEGKRILISVSGDKKNKFLPYLLRLEQKGWEIYATEGTHDFLVRHGLANRFLYKASHGLEPNIITAITNRHIDLIVNIPRAEQGQQSKGNTDGFIIRRLAIDNKIPLVTNLQAAQLLLNCLVEVDPDQIPVKSWDELVYEGGQ